MTEDPLGLLVRFLRFPTISTQTDHAEDLHQCAGWLANLLQSMGLHAEVHPTAGHPVVLARTPHDPAKRTILIYGHYDVQPPEPLDLWETPPFEPSLRNNRIYARGATDNKGQILAHVLGVRETLARTGATPVNIIFLIEGEEEIGSPSLEAFLLARRDELACDVICISDNGMAADFYPTLSYAMRGIAALEVRVKGPCVDLHSGVFGGAVMNPATAAARLVASLHDADGCVMIPGFYDAVLPLTDWERVAAEACPVTDADILAQSGAPALFGEPGYSAVERIGARPTAEVNGIGGGYQGEGTKTVLPSHAFIKLTFRLVPAMEPEKILDLAEAHLRAHCPPGVTIEIERGHSGMPYFSDPMSADGLAAQRAIERVFGAKPCLSREGGSIPILTTFKEILGADSLMLALASPDCAAHSPNENFPIRNFHAGIALNQALLEELAAVPREGIHGYRGDVPDLTAASRLA
ncbi:MAG: dipeptidase [Terrimicrobiaceae bacterium]|nr:dipeptidase [Terrimicrobiaceae bacterium]